MTNVERQENNWKIENNTKVVIFFLVQWQQQQKTSTTLSIWSVVRLSRRRPAKEANFNCPCHDKEGDGK